MKKYLITSLFLAFCLNTFSQKFFEQNFEEKNGTPFVERMTSEGWEEIQIKGDGYWSFENGGYTPSPGVPNSRRPVKAHSGNYNALFFKSVVGNTISRLITPKFDLSNATKPQLNFWFANHGKKVLGFYKFGKIKVYYHSDKQAKGEWIEIHQIIEEYQNWTKAEIPIPDSAKTANFQLAFEGDSHSAFGVCIDDIEVIETSKVSKFFHNVGVSQTYVNYDIPTGSKNNPILRLDLVVKGNENTLKIDKLVIDALEQSNEIVSSNGVKLFFTKTSYFSPTQQIANGVSFVNGQANFSNIDFDFPFGYSYLWVTYDINTDNNHTFNNQRVGAKIQKSNFIVDGKEYLSADLDPNSSRRVKESLFFDDFEGEKKWNLTGEFEIDSVQGKGGQEGGYPDPTFSQSGVKSLGTDLTGLGESKGNYEKNLTEDAYTATLKNSVDCEFYKDVRLLFYRWLNIELSDAARVKVSNDNKVNWDSVWGNPLSIQEQYWEQKDLSINDLAYRKKNVTPQFVLGPTNGTLNFSGWNIDDFAIVGTFIQYDAGISAWISPQEGCGHTAAESISVTVKNFGHDALTESFPIGYSIDGGHTWVKENVTTTLQQGATINFTFSNTIDMTAPGEHRILVKTFLPNDFDDLNDMIDTTIYVLPLKTIPYAENFENGHGFWRASQTDSSTWELGKPKGTKLKTAFSGIYAWGTNLSGNYKNNESSWIESPCLNFTDIERPVFEAMIAGASETGKDGLALYYSIDNGKTWKYAPKEVNYNWNWGKENIAALENKKGWDNTPNNDYQMVRQTLPAETANTSPVKIRLVFASDAQNTDEGFLIDDIRVYDAPIDVAPTDLISPTDACTLSNEETVKFKIQNKGIRKLQPKDIIYATLMQEDTLIVSDTFNIGTPVDINGKVEFSFSKKIDVSKNGLHKIKIYTHAPNDSNIYNGINDTLFKEVRMQGEPKYTLGPKIGTLDPTSVTIDAGGGYKSYLWKAPTGNPNNGVTTQTIKNVGEGTFSVTVINRYNCEARASVEVVKSITDLGVTAISGINSTCPTSDAATMQITIKNFSENNTYRKGDKIKIAYQINDENPVVEEYEIMQKEDSIKPKGTYNYTFKKQPVFSVSGKKVIKCFSVFEPDLDYSNDTTSKTIDVYELPKIDLGQDTIFTDMGNTIELDAGANLKNYEWQDGSTNRTFKITSKQSAMYRVKANDMNSCGTAHDTVWVITDNWGIDSIISPTNTCNGKSSENITLQLKNYSENTYSRDYEIPIQIKFNNVVKLKNIKLTQDVSPKATYEHTFTNILDMSQKGIYDFEAKINPIHDIDTNNNIDKVQVENYEVPIVELNYGDTLLTKRADTILLDASNRFTYYKWEKNDETVGNKQTYNIRDKSSALYLVTTKDKNNCRITKDSVQIMASDLRITEIISPRRSCKLGEINSITFKIKNEGNDILQGGTEMYVWYNLNNSENWVKKEFTLPSDLSPQQENTISVKETLVFEGEKNYDFSLVIRYSKDLFTNNDTIKTKVYQFETPTVNLGADIFTTQPDTIQLDAGEGLSYLWQDGSTEQVYKLEKEAVHHTKNYSVVVSNSFGCTATDTVLVFTKDVSLELASGHNNTCDVGEREIGIDIKINGKDTLLNDSFAVWVKLDNGEKITETGTVSTKTSAENPFRYTLKNKIAVADTGNHTLTAGIIFANDVNLQNNEVSTSFRVGPILVNLGEDIKTSAAEYILKPSVKFKQYRWDNGSTQESRTVTKSGEYWLEVTDSNGCSSRDTIKVSFVNPKYKITEIIGLSNACSSEQEKTVNFNFKNEGTDTLQVGESIKITYQVNEKTPIEENYTFTKKLKPEEQIKISFANHIILSEIGEQKIKINVLQESNSLATADIIISIFSLPIIDLGDNVKTLEESHIIDAGNGFSSYLWSTGETTQTITVTKNGTYQVTVTNTEGCEANDSITVLFVPVAVSIEPISSLSQCIPIDETIKINIKNTGEKEIKAGSKFVLAYQLANEKRVNDPIEVKEKIERGKSLVHNFQKPIQIKTAGNYPISFFINIEDVDIDTSKFTFVAKEAYIFAFDIDTLQVSKYPYELNANVTADAYLWNNGETTQSIQVNKNALYTLTTIHNNGCRFSDSIFVVSLSGINDEWSRKIKIYPNPASEKLTIELPEFIEKTSIEISTMNGKIVQQEENVSEKHNINLTDYKQGIYFVKIKNIKHYAVFKLVVH